MTASLVDNRYRIKMKIGNDAIGVIYHAVGEDREYCPLAQLEKIFADLTTHTKNELVFGCPAYQLGGEDE